MIDATQSPLGHLQIGRKQSEETASDGMGRDVFLRLLTTQMQSQNPLNPQDNSEFVAQLAQFTQVESLDGLNNNFDAFTGSFMSGQALDAANLVGKNVTVKTDRVQLTSSGELTGKVSIPAGMNDVRVSLTNSAGQVVETIPLGSQFSGEVDFHWDGQQMRVNGEAFDWMPSSGELAAGDYKVSASGKQGDQSIALTTALRAEVERVSIKPNGQVSLHLAGMGQKVLSDIVEFNSTHSS